MKKVIRRLTVYPFMVALFPIAVPLIWLMFDDETWGSSFKYGISVLEDTWG